MAYPRAVSGDGAYIVDATGKRYLDASGGAAVSCLGHSDEGVVSAIRDQLERLPFAHTSFFTNDAVETLAEALGFSFMSSSAARLLRWAGGCHERLAGTDDTVGISLREAME